MTQRRRPTVVVVSLLAVASLVATLPGSATTSRRNQPASASTKPDVLTPLVATPLASPHPVVGADGRRHLAYELQLVNAYGVAITVDKVETIDRATGKVLGVLEGDAVAAHMVLLPLGTPAGATVGPGGAGFLVMDASLPKGRDVPRRLAHRFSLSFEPDTPELPDVERSGSTRVVRDKPVVVARPLRGSRWVDVGGCCADLTGHRGAVQPANGAFHLSQRFAIDFVQLDAEGRLFVEPPEELSSYPFYGADVLSVAKGVVVRTQDGIPDNTPVGSLPPVTVTNAGGNYVVVDIGRDRFAFYAHLQPGSLRVDVGDHVKRGQVLALLGNSGNSDAPHLHFHVMDGSSPFGSEGLPYEFRSFGSEGILANPDEVLAGGSARTGPFLRGRHSRQLPLDLEVISFPSGNGRH